MPVHEGQFRVTGSEAGGGIRRNGPDGRRGKGHPPRKRMGAFGQPSRHAAEPDILRCLVREHLVNHASGSRPQIMGAEGESAPFTTFSLAWEPAFSPI